MTTRIILTALSETKRPYMRTFDSSETFYPRLSGKGGLGHSGLEKSEHDFLFALAIQPGIWFPADSHRDPPLIDQALYWITEAIWVQLEPGPGNYYKFTFEPPLEIIHPLPDINDPYR